MSFDIDYRDQARRDATRKIMELLRVARTWPDFSRYEPRIVAILSQPELQKEPVTMLLLRKVYIKARRQQRTLDAFVKP